MMTLLKSCPTCRRTYSDPTFSFCLDDGSLLSTAFEQISYDETELETVIRTQTSILQEDKRPTVADISEPVLLITVNRLYKPDISPELSYEITRGVWRISERRNKAKYAFAVYKGIIREVYEIDSWHPAQDDSDERKKWIADKDIKVDKVTRQRWQFDGHLSTELRHYVGQSTAKHQVRGAQNPIKYVNC
ncbi:MAG: hypothetical protein ACKVRN_09865 [Pyrinomonadaceae bacterium]